MRITRATARLLEEDPEQAVAVPFPGTPQLERTPLGEITGNTQDEANKVTIVVDFSKAIKSGSKIGCRKTKAGRKHKHKESVPEILEDENESASSSAVDEACEELLRPLTGSDMYQVPMHDHDRPLTPPSKAVRRARKQLTPKSHTPRFDPALHKSPEVQRSPTRARTDDWTRRDSFFEVIESRSPVKLTQPEVPIDEEDEAIAESIAAATINKQTPLRSPNIIAAWRKHHSRKEDSLNALDAMEDALDEVNESLAKVDQPERVSALPRKRSHQVKGGDKSNSCMPKHARASKLVCAVSSTKSTNSAAKEVKKNAPEAAKNRKPLSPGIETKATRPLPKAVPASTPIHQQPVVTSITKKSFMPAKSQKQVTTSSFKLPGEAVAAKLRAQQEARLASGSSANGSCANVSTTSSSTTTRRHKSSAPEVRMTATARARLSIARGEKPTPQSVPGIRPSAKLSIYPAKGKVVPNEPALVSKARLSATPKATAVQVKPLSRPNTKSVSPILASLTGKPKANTPVKRIAKASSGVAGVKIDSGLKRISSESLDAPIVKKPVNASAKVIVAKRPLNDKAEAARRARAEAAERGRLASRQWAERMKKRQSAVTAAKGIEGKQ